MSVGVIEGQGRKKLYNRYLADADASMSIIGSHGGKGAKQFNS